MSILHLLSPSICDPLDPSLDPNTIHPDKTLRAWSKQTIDMDSPMLASTTPFYRHALISTGKKDWVHDVATVDGSLAQWFQEWAGEIEEEKKGKETLQQDAPQAKHHQPMLPEGVWQSTLPPSSAPSSSSSKPIIPCQARTAQDHLRPLPGGPSRVLVSNASHISSSRHHHGQNVMLFPDWVMLSDVCDGQPGEEAATAVAEDKERTRELYREHIAAAPSSTSSKEERPRSRPRRTVLPYRAVVVLCSHNKRDARCGIAAPMLAEVLKRHAEAAGWEVDERADHVDHHHDGEADEEGSCEFHDLLRVPAGRGWGHVHETSTADDSNKVPSPEEQILSWRKELCDPSSSYAPSPSLGIFYCSHIGKHAWAGNVIVYFPSGSGVWYGRVDPKEGAGRVFQETILKGKVIGELLRAGINLYRGEGADELEDVVSGTKEELVGGVKGRTKSLLAW